MLQFFDLDRFLGVFPRASPGSAWIRRIRLWRDMPCTDKHERTRDNRHRGKPKRTGGCLVPRGRSEREVCPATEHQDLQKGSPLRALLNDGSIRPSSEAVRSGCPSRSPPGLIATPRCARRQPVTKLIREGKWPNGRSLSRDAAGCQGLESVGVRSGLTARFRAP